MAEASITMADDGASREDRQQSFEASFMRVSDGLPAEHDAIICDPAVWQTLQTMQDQIFVLHNTVVDQNHQLAKLNTVLTEVTYLNDSLFGHVRDLKERFETLEHSRESSQAVTEAETIIEHSVTPQSSAAQYPTENGVHTAVGAVLPTPATSDAIANWKPSQTFLNKRESHNLTNMIPPPTVPLPLVPLTDVELMVFFYNYVSRPLVALRLYARNWGPSDITRVLNEHRDIRPDGYHRNTCSVKCTTAIKRGRERSGMQWENRWRQFFTRADDVDATDMLRQDERESHSATSEDDYRVLDLLVGLKKFPSYDDDEQTGVFSRAVEWCAENEVDIGLSQIHKIVIALEHDSDPADALMGPDEPDADDRMVPPSRENHRESITPTRSSPAAGVSSTLSTVDEELLALHDSEALRASSPAANPAKKKMCIKPEHSIGQHYRA